MGGTDDSRAEHATGGIELRRLRTMRLLILQASMTLCQMAKAESE